MFDHKLNKKILTTHKFKVVIDLKFEFMMVYFAMFTTMALNPLSLGDLN